MSQQRSAEGKNHPRNQLTGLFGNGQLTAQKEIILEMSDMYTGIQVCAYVQ
jgi:hypothetical protein